MAAKFPSSNRERRARSTGAFSKPYWRAVDAHRRALMSDFPPRHLTGFEGTVRWLVNQGATESDLAQYDDAAPALARKLKLTNEE